MNILKEFVAAAFAEFGLDWQDHVVSDPQLLRPSDIMTIRANPGKAERKLAWLAKKKMPDVVREMVAAERCG